MHEILNIVILKGIVPMLCVICFAFFSPALAYKHSEISADRSAKHLML